MARGFLKNIFRGWVICLLSGAVFLFSDVFAAGSGYNVQLTVPNDPILEVKVNTDGTGDTAKASLNVAPASLSSAAFNEKNVTISVSTNNDWGYTLVMNVANTNLVSVEDSSKTIPTLSLRASHPFLSRYTCTSETADTCDFTVNSWGFKIRNATRVAPATEYIGAVNSITINKWTGSTGSNGIANDPTYLSFGSRINAAQAPGTYQTTVAFAATANPDPTPIMQNVTASTLASLLPSNGSMTTAKDSRDSNKYQITNINGTYWMTENLRITHSSGKSAGVISAEGSNFTGGDIQMTSSSGSQFRDYNVSRYYDSGDTTTGVYYNYCSASANTICSNNLNSDAVMDICPAGWRLPTHSDYQAIANVGGTVWNPVAPGWYNTGKYESGVGGYYGATTYNANRSYGLLYYPNGTFNADGAAISRDCGTSIRCVFTMPMQDTSASTLASLMPNDGSTTVLRDLRDNNKYRITNINGTYWMADNLRITGTIPAAGSNFIGADFNISAGGDLTAGDTDTAPRAHYNTADTNSATYGAYYNYCAASAGTVCDSTVQQDATSDICPKGWRLPTYTEITTVRSYYPSRNSARAGYYASSSLRLASSMGFWWSATARNAYNHYRLSNSDIDDSHGSYGFSIGCLYYGS